MRNIVIDLGNLEYLYSDTINAFIASNRHMLEVSGRIAILTEHPKVQDILKRAGLDNIMRIYRSEAEMIADAKEILRQTSSYRIDELQKAAASSQQTVQIPAQIPTPPPIPKSEFEDFRFEMGEQLGSKLDNNEVPQYQYGPNASTPAIPKPPSAPIAPAPIFEMPATPPANQGYGNNFNTGYVPPASQPTAPSYGGYTPPNFGNAPVAPPSGYTGDSRLDNSQGPGFDFPTVQLPVGSYAQTPPPSNTDDQDGSQAGYDSEDEGGNRNRKSAEDRMRSPNARKAGNRRVGGREGAAPQMPGMEESAYTPGAAASTSQPESPTSHEPYGSGTNGPIDPNGPFSRPSTLVEEKSSSTKALVFIALVVLIGFALFMFTLGGDDDEKKPETTNPSVTENPVTPAPAAVDSAVAIEPAPAPVEPSAAPAEPTTPAVTPTPPTPAPTPVVKAPPAKPQTTESKPPRTTKKPTKSPTPKVVEEPPDEPRVTPSPTAAEGQILIVSNPSGADVLVNFSKKGQTPLTVALGNNTNRIIVRKDGFKRYETTLNKGNTDKELTVDLIPEEGSSNTEETPVEEPRVEPPKPEPVVSKPKPEPKPEPKFVEPPPEPVAKAPEPEAPPTPKPKPAPSFSAGSGPPGLIFLSSSPARADILVDGKETGKKTPAKLELPSGMHRIEMVKSGQKASVEQMVGEGKNKALHLNLQ